jgi:peptidoglycan/LPS O-acetylase OafA/YrhL
VVATLVVLAFAGAHLAAARWPRAWGEEALIGTYAVAAAVLLPALLSRSIPARVLALRPMVFIGERSYSLYLVQLIAAATVSGLLPSSAHSGTRYLVATVLVGLAGADLLYRWVEQPMIEVGRRLAARQRGPAREVPPARTVPGLSAPGAEGAPSGRAGVGADEGAPAGAGEPGDLREPARSGETPAPAVAR